MNKDTLIIMTGGTIDAEAYADPAHPPKVAEMLPNSLIPMTVTQMGHGERCDTLSWRAKDSKHFTDEDMADLARIIRTSRAKNIIITHGTDAMPENSRRIRALLMEEDKKLREDAMAGPERFIRGEAPEFDKRVIFTGAMMPLANGQESDAYQNLEFIFDHMDSWKPGVRAVMHAKCFDPVGLAKDFDTFTFHGHLMDDSKTFGAGRRT